MVISSEALQEESEVCSVFSEMFEVHGQLGFRFDNESHFDCVNVFHVN